MGRSSDGIQKTPHPEEAAKAAVSKDARRQSSQCGISCSASALVVERRGGLLKSLATEEVARPYFASLTDPETQAWSKKLMAAAELVTITERIVACRDPTDDKFLELAVNGHADLPC